MLCGLPIVFLHPAVFHLYLRVQDFQGPGYSGSMFFRIQVFRVHVFLGPGFSGSRFISFQVQVQGPGPGFRSSPFSWVIKQRNLKQLRNCIVRIIRAWSLFCSVRVYISPFSTYSFEKVRYHLSVFFVFKKFHFKFYSLRKLHL